MFDIPNKKNADSILEYFSSNGLKDYAYKRNYDFGQKNQTNVSKLSPFIRKRIIHEKDIIKHALKKFEYKKVEKFVQEVFWRTYWKGWLEGRKKVWLDYLESLEKFQNEKLPYDIKKNYKKAISGSTGINCFDSWVDELINYGYLHNHSRMWFASIWIHSLSLPWELGANFFFENLLDADPASNTLSWRWVAGLQTQGKAYLAKKENIEKFSSFKIIEDEILAKKAINFPYHFYEYKKIDFQKSKVSDNDIYIINENNLIYSQEHINMLKKLELFVIDNQDFTNDSIKKKKFNKIALLEYLKYLDGFKISYKKINNIKNLKEKIKENPEKNIFSHYPGVGYELEKFESYSKLGIKINYIYDDYDLMCWPIAKAGFFKFKLKIPDFLESIVC